MIHSKLKKGKTSELLVEFSRVEQKWPTVIQKFYETCKQQNVKLNKTTSIKPEMVRFYSIEQSSESLFPQNSNQCAWNLDNILKSHVSSVDIKYTVIYINEENYRIPEFQEFVSDESNQSRVLLLRQTLDSYFDLNYEVQNTLSQQESIIYLCDLAAMIINCKHETEIELYDQKKDKMIRKGNQGEMTEMEIIWKNILFQTPGLGKDKCKAIAEKYPTYRHIIKDCDKDKQLKNLQVGKGTKSMKIGSSIAERLYKVFGSLNGKQTLY